MNWLKFLVTLGFLFEAPRVNVPGGSGTGAGGVDDKDYTKDDLALINADDDEGQGEGEEGNKELEEGQEGEEGEEKPKKKGKEKEDEEEPEEGEEGDEEEEEDKEEGQEEEEEEAPEPDPLKAATYAAIKKKYPDFFKDFPAAKNEIFAADAFRKVFPSVEDAKEAAGIVEMYNGLQGIVVAGETDKFLTEIKEYDAEAFKNFSGNFLPALFSTDEKLYYSIVTPVVRSAIKRVIELGVAKGGKVGGQENNEGQNIINAAIVAHLELFGNKDVLKDDEPVVKKDTKLDPEKEKFNKERADYYNQRYNDLQQNIQTSYRGAIVKDIEKGLDPTGTMSDYTRKNLVRDIFSEIDSTLGKDKAHIGFVNSLWKKEQSAGFTGQNKDRILNAVLSRARPLIPAIRQRLRAEALKGKGKVIPGKKFGEKKNDVTPGKVRSKEKTNLKDTKNLSDLDIINMD